MTSRGSKGNLRAYKFDIRSIYLLDNMTDHFAQILKDFIENKTHPLTCVCCLCLWRKYEKIKKPIGHPYDFLTFLARDIIDYANDPFLDEALKKIPTQRIAAEVVRRLPLFSPETKAVIKAQAWNFDENYKIYSRRKRYQAKKLLNCVADLKYLRHKDWVKSKPVPVMTINFKKKFRTEGQVLQGIFDFIKANPGKKATQRELCRYLNRPISEIEAARDVLKQLFGIEVRTEGRSIVYFIPAKG